ncbi:hypothetical protein [Curtobacterium sp. 1544]|uniref:hypothetical protein n=1 Tax=Curtobacterium sp. 1544 TaxID=3156417 RepID=UPI003398D81B
MKVKKSRVGLLVAAAATAGLILSAAAPASAGTYTWINKPTLSNATYKEPGQSTSFSRTGVKSYLAADGYYWDTTLWLGSYSAHGYATASISSKLSNQPTKVFWKYTNDPNTKTKVNLRVTLQGVPGGPTGARSASAASDSLPKIVDPSAVGEGLDVATAEHVGDSDGVAYWRGLDSAGNIAFLAVDGEYASSTTVTAEQFHETGVTLRTDGSNGSHQGVLVPEQFAASTDFEEAGLTKAGENLFVEDTPQATNESVVINEGGSSAQRQSRAAAQDTLTVHLFGAPQ